MHPRGARLRPAGCIFAELLTGKTLFKGKE
jgi:hypothetical protein